VYIFNDIYDLESDRRHPVKRLRPLASNQISIKKGGVIGVFLMTISLLGIWSVNEKVFFVFVSYLCINVMYNLFLKKIPIVDVVIISCCFVIRILVGSFATEIPPSFWILTMTFLLAMFLGFSKRRSDLLWIGNGENKVSNIGIFTLKSINTVLFVFAGLICVTYICYTNNESVVENVGSPFVLITNIFVILGVIRYMKLLYTSKTYKDPTAIVISDSLLQLIIGVWVCSFLLVKYI